MFPYAEASWDAVDGAMFMGWGTSLPGITTFIAAALCVVVLVVGQMSETAKAKRFDR
jgi:Ca2+/Na+ antiporter